MSSYPLYFDGRGNEVFVDKNGRLSSHREMYSRYRDENGSPNERTPITHPYSFDGYVTWANGEKATDGVYTDRLYEWDYAKTEECWKKHMTGISYNWDERNPDKVESFLRDRLGWPSLKLVRIMKYCNHSSGYPTWRLDFWHEANEITDCKSPTP